LLLLYVSKYMTIPPLVSRNLSMVIYGETIQKWSASDTLVKTIKLGTGQIEALM